MIDFELNEYGYVSKLIINNEEEILINDLCSETSESKKLFILFLSEILRTLDIDSITQEHLNLFNYEMSRFGISPASNIKQLIEQVKKFDINFSYFILQWVDYIKETIGFPYDAEFLFVSEILEHIFATIQQKLPEYQIKLKDNNSFFVMINTNNFRSIRNHRKLKIAIQKYSLNFRDKNIIFIPNDFLISITKNDITDNINIQDCFRYFDKPNFILNMFKSIGIEHPSIEQLFSNYNIPIFFTDVFDIVIKKEKENS